MGMGDSYHHRVKGVVLSWTWKLNSIILYCIVSPFLPFSSSLVQAASVSSENGYDAANDDDIFASLSSSHIAVAGVLCALVLLLVVVLVIPGCMDCMNSEVSSENHPACDSSTPKWGGASGYTSSSQNSHFVMGESAQPTSGVNQSLPYAYPSHVPEQAGFSGYQPAGFSGYQPASSGAGGYGAAAGGSVNMGHSSYPSHYNPMDQEPPPPYSESR